MGRKNTSPYVSSAKNLSTKNHADKIDKKILKESWFNKKTFHYAYEETNPYIYAMACVEIVATHSKEGGMIFNQIINAWNKPGVKQFQKDFNSSITDEDRKEMKDVTLEFFKDPKKPFVDLLELTSKPGWWKPLLEKGDSETKDLSPEDETSFSDLFNGLWKITEFILVGFNRKSDVRRGIYRVIPRDNPMWLYLAVLNRTLSEHSKITMAEMIKNYKTVHKGDKTVDYEAILTGSPTNREHRRLIEYSRNMKLKLKHDKKYLDAAYLWYQCRVRYSSIEKYCNSQNQRTKMLDPKNILKKIKPCDKAIGYYSGRIKKQIS